MNKIITVTHALLDLIENNKDVSVGDLLKEYEKHVPAPDSSENVLDYIQWLNIREAVCYGVWATWHKYTPLL